MARVIIRHLGAVVSIDIRLRQVNFFIGPQSIGKSTLARIISFFSWMEKANSSTRKISTEGVMLYFLRYYRMEDFLCRDTVVVYEGENVFYYFNSGLKSGASDLFEQYKTKDSRERLFFRKDVVLNPKVQYIPAERNFVSSVPAIKEYVEDYDYLQIFADEWYSFKRRYRKGNALPILNLGVKYEYHEDTDEDFLVLSNGKPIPLSSSSSGLQSLVPLCLLVQYLSTGIYDKNVPFSPQENERFRQIFMKLEESSGSRAETEMIDQLRVLLKGKAYSHTQFIIEEPEQNLFPETQKSLVFFLLASINHGKNHRLVVTTHSPYILYALNNALLAHHIKDVVPAEEKKGIESLKYPFNPDQVAVWQFKNGCLRGLDGGIHKTIQDGKGLIRANYFNSIMNSIIEDFNKMICFYGS